MEQINTNNINKESSQIKVNYTYSIIVLIIAAVFLLIGTFASYKVYDKDTEDFGILAFNKIKDTQLVVDATFGGTIKKGDKLYSTYDRSEPVGKRACLT